MDKFGQQIMDQQQQATRFADLFCGNDRAYGGDTGRAVWSEVSLETYERHLTGVEPMGIYPVAHTFDERTVVKWGCCDIDTGDWNEAYMLASALQGMGLRPWVERSRSKGWHIWVFSDEWIDAKDMRRCLKVAYSAIGLPAKEANPKSESLRPNQLGNYVRLPYKAAFALDGLLERQTMMQDWNRIGDGAPMLFNDFISTPQQQLLSDHRRIQHWATKWYEPARKHVHVDVTDEDVLALAALLPDGWRKIWLEGQVRDRSATFVAMAHNLAKLGWQPQQVFTILWGCPWNKYRDRNDGVGYVQDIVERAFS